MSNIAKNSKVNKTIFIFRPKRRRCVKSEDSDSEDQRILQQRNGRRKCTKTKVKNSSFRNKYDRVEAEDPEDVIVQPKNKGSLISECIIIIFFWPNSILLSQGFF